MRSSWFCLIISSIYLAPRVTPLIGTISGGIMLVASVVALIAEIKGRK